MNSLQLVMNSMQLVMNSLQLVMNSLLPSSTLSHPLPVTQTCHNNWEHEVRTRPVIGLTTTFLHVYLPLQNHPQLTLQKTTEISCLELISSSHLPFLLNQWRLTTCFIEFKCKLSWQLNKDALSNPAWKFYIVFCSLKIIRQDRDV
jgi:hypothetical protein